MKYITFAIPSYNSQNYLKKAVDSLLIAKEDIEIIIVNDGSTDKTLEIARNYEEKYPNSIKVIDKKNGGHGSGVNAGLKNAKGLYYKVLDSDDWINEATLIDFIGTIKKHYEEKKLPDLYVFDFIYEHVEDNTSFVRSYKKNFIENEITNWNQMKKKFKYSQTMLMHAQVFKTKLLIDAGINLPEHTFYVDNIMSYIPLLKTQTIYYINKVLYHYFIGRADQSIQVDNLVRRYQQQIRVMNIILDACKYEEVKKLDKKLKRYIKHFLSRMMIITQMFTVGEINKIRKEDLKKLWLDLKLRDKKMYKFLKYKTVNVIANFLPTRLKRWVFMKGYYYLTKKVKLG